MLKRMHELLEASSLSRKDFEGLIYNIAQDVRRSAEDIADAKKPEDGVGLLRHMATQVNDLFSLYSALKPCREKALEAIKILKATAPAADRQVVEDRTVSPLEEQFELALKMLQNLPRLISSAKYKRAREVVSEIEAELQKARTVIDREEKSAEG